MISGKFALLQEPVTFVGANPYGEATNHFLSNLVHIERVWRPPMVLFNAIVSDKKVLLRLVSVNTEALLKGHGGTLTSDYIAERMWTRNGTYADSQTENPGVHGGKQ